MYPEACSIHLLTQRLASISSCLCKLDKKEEILKHDAWLNRLSLVTVREGGPFRETEQEEKQVSVGKVWLGHADHILHTFFYPATTY